MEHFVEVLSQRKDLLELSNQPVQKELGMKKVHVLCARWVANTEQRTLADSGRWSEVSFTKGQEKLFAVVQITLNKHLTVRNEPNVPLLHLSARMIISDCVDCEKSSENQLDVIIPPKMALSKRQKSKVRAAARKSLNDMPHAEVAEHVPCKINFESQLSLDLGGVPCSGPISSIEPPRVVSLRGPIPSNLSIPLHLVEAVFSEPLESSSRQHRDSDRVERIGKICATYEELLQQQREQHEEIQQSLNLRLFIAQTEVANLTEKLAFKLANSTS